MARILLAYQLFQNANNSLRDSKKYVTKTCHLFTLLAKIGNVTTRLHGGIMEDCEKLKKHCGHFPKYKYTNDGRAYVWCWVCGKTGKPAVNNILAGENWNKEE